MLIIPAIYLSGGQVVSHYKGERDQAKVMSRDPLYAARDFEREGATMLHVVDLDAGSASGAAHFEMLAQIKQKTKLSLWYADGITDLSEMTALFEAGVSKISLNQDSEALLAAALKQFGAERVSFTIRTERHLIPGKPGVEVVDYGREIAENGVAEIIFRDIKSEGTMHPNFDEVDRLILGTTAKIYSFGGAGSMDDLDILQRTGVAGVMISRAFFEGRLSLRACLAKFQS